MIVKGLDSYLLAPGIAVHLACLCTDFNHMFLIFMNFRDYLV